jgi:hypothetical protein
VREVVAVVNADNAAPERVRCQDDDVSGAIGQRPRPTTPV